jgi:hypothetical protein
VEHIEKGRGESIGGGRMVEVLNWYDVTEVVVWIRYHVFVRTPSVYYVVSAATAANVDFL